MPRWPEVTRGVWWPPGPWGCLRADLPPSSPTCRPHARVGGRGVLGLNERMESAWTRNKIATPRLSSAGPTPV